MSMSSFVLGFYFLFCLAHMIKKKKKIILWWRNNQSEHKFLTAIFGVTFFFLFACCILSLIWDVLRYEESGWQMIWTTISYYQITFKHLIRFKWLWKLKVYCRLLDSKYKIKKMFKMQRISVKLWRIINVWKIKRDRQQPNQGYMAALHSEWGFNSFCWMWTYLRSLQFSVQD